MINVTKNGGGNIPECGKKEPEMFTDQECKVVKHLTVQIQMEGGKFKILKAEYLASRVEFSFWTDKIALPSCWMTSL